MSLVMKKISQVKIKNFKAFQEEQIFDLKGKNVLAYGNNGSGKSSLFWAL
jgi:AAA15 family ATPase/GTPase